MKKKMENEKAQLYKHPKRWITFCKPMYKKNLQNRLSKILKESGVLRKVETFSCLEIEALLSMCLYEMNKYIYSVDLKHVNINSIKSLDDMFNLMPKPIDELYMYGKSKNYVRMEIQQINFHIVYDTTIYTPDTYKNFISDIYMIKSCIYTFYKFYPTDLNKVNLFVYIEIIIETKESENTVDVKIPEKLFNENIEWRKLMYMKNIGLCRKITRLVKKSKKGTFCNLKPIHVLFNNKF